ncbi:mucin-2-like isoform X14 [Plodia interpunctella]|uniref:mucin-2-like isoform X14 n=1 Tax=Plodia interpunctella TaxID=58824 RepID=UPI002368A6EC|nr:mucin-17-like isoform X14 [Plodia interpunctella]
MRTVWWCATAVALLAVTSALRTTQVEGASRYNRRQPSPTAADVRSSTEAEPSEAAPTFKPRSSRRQEIPQRAVQTRSQSKRPLQRIDASTEANPSQPRDERNERYDSKRISSRTRSKNIENITTETPKQREPINRSRSRQGIRKTQYSTLQRSTEISSSITDDKSDTVDRIITARKENNADNQFRRRSSSVQTVEAVAPKKLRGRINTRPNARSLDLDVSGTTNGLSSFEKEPTTARNSDLRNSRKLRYKQRLSETDTNLTGEGITASSVVAPVKSSQKNESIPSQSEIQAPVQIVFAETQPTIQSSTETLSSTPASTTTKATKVLKRPLARGKVNFKPSATAPKVPSTDEISEDDNYPESFKALIQAKNASTQASSPSSESLTLKASQKIYKTHATLSQSNTGTSQNKNSRLRHKLNTQDEIKKDEKQEDKIVVTSPEPVKAKKPEFRPRGTYNPRRRKLTSFSPTTVSTNSLDQSTAKPAYKYNRKFKLTTTESPKKETMERSSVESSTSLKKTFVRPTVYYRKSFNRKSSTTERSSEEKSTNSEVSNLKPKIVPRTSYYSRFRNNKNKTSSVEASKEVINDTISVESKTEDNAEMPLIYTLLNNSAKNNTLVSENQIKDNESKEMFIIAVTSKESQEQNIVSETVNAIEENGHKLVISENPTTVKYHAIYKDPDSINRLENVEPTSGSTTPIVRNLQTGRTTRKRTKSYEKDIDIPNTVTPKTREKNIRKYGDSYLKPSEELSSVISSEPDKVKGRFSSKFRASYLDKPFYKPTVPSVTSTTTVEGEEIDLGPDVNAISFTKTRSKLTSADLKLSESLVKPSHIMNVEATHHSPSVTVSIFDALAEILTSTPKPRLSSTTEVSQNQNTNNDVVKPFNGVSNSINVNSVKGFASQDTTSAGANTNAKLVQNTDQTQNVINRLSVGESTQPLNTEDGKFNPVNTLPSTPLSTPTPTTPISARRPFAIKVLYSEQSTDQSTTAPEPTPVNMASTDLPTTTKQIRTEKPSDGTGSAVFKFIPIDEVTLAPQNSNVLKLATKTVTTDISMNTASTVTETNTQTPQVQTSKAEDATTSISITMGTPIITEVTESSTSATTITTTTFAPAITTTEAPTSVFASTTRVPTTSTTESAPITLTTEAATNMPTTVSSTFPPTTIPISTITAEEKKRYQEDTQFLQQLLLGTTDPKNFNIQSNSNLFTDLTTTALPSTTVVSLSARQIEEAKLLQALLSAGQNPIVTNTQRNVKGTVSKTTTSRSIDADLKQLEEDTKFLKALLQATGQNPANFNLPTFDIKTTTRAAVPSTTTTTTTTRPTTTTTVPTTTLGTTTSIDADIKKLKEDTKLLQALLQAVGQNPINNPSPPIITGVTSNVRIASNPLTTSLGSNPTTPINVRPVYTSQSTTQAPPQTLVPRTVLNTLQPTTTEAVRISTTINPRRPTTTRSVRPTTVSARKAQVSGGASTTEMPSTSTFSVEEDLVFLKNLKSVLKANPNNDDPEAALANRIIALAVERSLNEIQTGTSPDVRTGKKIANNVNNVIPTTTPRTTTARTTSTTTTTTTTTTTPSTTTVIASNPSLEADIKQFQEDTKLLQALIKATGQDPSQFNIPTLPPLTNVKVSPNIKPEINTDLKVLSNLLTSPSPLTEQFDSITQKPKRGQTKYNDTTDLPFGAKIAVKDDLQTVQDDAKLLKTLVKLQDVRPTTTQRNKLALTGHTSDEALKKLLQQQSPKSGMVSEATQPPMSLSTEYGKSNDALLAALLKEQGFGPTTASSSDEQIRLSALLNQVVVTPKARRTTTPPPPPPPRRPILDGLAWLWQQWRETAPGPTAARPNRRPSPSASPSVATSAATSNRVNWFGSGPFVGNAEDKPSPNRIPLEPPGAVTSEQTPGRGQLVSAAINVTRAFSQFLGAAIQGAAQTVQSVIRAGQRAASDVYVNGSGGSG